MKESEQIALPVMTHGRSAIDGLLVVRRRWRTVALSGLIGLALGITYFLLSPSWYQASIMIVPKEKSAGGLGGAVGAMLGDLPIDVGAAAGPLIGGTDGERIAAILRSRSTTDAVIAKFKLMERYEITMIEDARKKLWKLCATKVERKPNLVVLSCEDTEPEVARDIAEYFGQAADEGFRRIANSSASEERKFLEKRAAEARTELDKASIALRAFQEKHKIIDLPEQSKAVVSAMARLEGDLISKRVQLAYLTGFASRDESSAAQLVRQMAIVRQELDLLQQQRSPALEQAADPENRGSDLFPPAMEVPRMRYELEGLFREQKIRETVFVLLTERFESLKVDEARDLSTFVVFDHAIAPTDDVRPKLRVVPVTALIGFVIGLMIVVLPGWWRDLQRRVGLERLSPRQPS